VQPHLSKCFENIKSLAFTETEAGDQSAGAMSSSEGEVVPFPRAVLARGLVEVWLSRVEAAMSAALRTAMARCVSAVQVMPHAEWMFAFPAQCVIAVEQMVWARGVEEALEGAGASLLRTGGLEGLVGPAARKARATAAGEALKEFQRKWKDRLDSLVALVRGELEPLQRSIVGVLIVIDVHARDVVDRMIKDECSSAADFAWTKQLRYYWDADADQGVVRQTNTQQTYGYEYLGSTPRLVITPLTDRCYLTLTTALHYNLGGSPAGPAGTGKTETVKDLAKALARQCVVFNCSEGLDYQMMGRFFSGLAQAGAWACFDEFNRIDIEVLSVIAQQLLTILSAVQERVDRFSFEGRDIELNPHCGFFITMNPGYAGRTELPDNLKALFRPVAMMIPDYAMIAEIMLYSEGFLGAHGLARKMADLYRLASEQLSQQDHYDFGMRAVKSVLVMAGALKRSDQNLAEDTVLIRAFRDTNVPKFLAEDVPLFMGIIGDLFPGVDIPAVDHGDLRVAVEAAARDLGLQVVERQVGKVIQLFETQTVRHGVMLVGLAGTGKTSVLNCLGDALGDLCDRASGRDMDDTDDDDDGDDDDDEDDDDNNNNNNNNNNDGRIGNGDDDDDDNNDNDKDNGGDGDENNNDVNKVLSGKKQKPKVRTTRRSRERRPRRGPVAPNPGYQHVERHFLNPKALTMGELYGQFNEVSHEWTDGLVAKLVRECVAHQESPDKRWIVFDGPVDALWIENMNTVLDDNKTLCLANGERIRLTKQMNMVFEVNDLAVASPATVSRCGMVYLEEVHLGWRHVARSWAERLEERLDAKHCDRILELLERVIDPTIAVIRSRCREYVGSTNIGAVMGLLNLLDSLLVPEYGVGTYGWTPAADGPAGSAAAAAAAAAAAGAGAGASTGAPSAASGSTSNVLAAGGDDAAEGRARTSSAGSAASSADGGGGNNDGGNNDGNGQGNGDSDAEDPAETAAALAAKIDITDDEHITAMVDLYFIFAYIWGLGGNLSDPASRSAFALHAVGHIRAINTAFPVTLTPDGGDVTGDIFALYPEPRLVAFASWASLTPSPGVSPTTPYFNLLVPTADNIRFRFLLGALCGAGHHVLLNGTTGTGKTTAVLSHFAEPFSLGDPWGSSADDGGAAEGAGGAAAMRNATLTLSGQTTARMLQEIIESRLDKRRKNLFGPPPGGRCVLFVDDLNMPSPDEYGSQPPVELLRQLIDKGGWYERTKLFFRRIVGTQLIAACGPPGGGRTKVTERLTRRFALLCVPEMSDQGLMAVFGPILAAHLDVMRDQNTFSVSNVAEAGAGCVAACVEMYRTLRAELLPTPAKSHYTFNLRDLSKVVQGMVQVRPGSIGGRKELARLWYHESARVFEDRLVDDADRDWFRSLAQRLLRDRFGFGSSDGDGDGDGDDSVDPEALSRVLFGDYLTPADEEIRVYEEIGEPERLPRLFEDHLEDYNAAGTSQEMNLVFFDYAIEHISRVSRILRQPRGHALLVGVGGSGRQSVTRLAAHMAGHKLFSIEITKSYGQVEFREDLKKVLMIAGVENRPVCFLFTDTQIVQETFLEDINNILNSGEVPNLFAADEKEKIVTAVRPLAKRAGAGEARDDVMAHFTHLVRENLHIVLAFSPAGSALRNRCRLYPALINCCTVIWYRPWPTSALRAVAEALLARLPLSEGSWKGATGGGKKSGSSPLTGGSSGSASIYALREAFSQAAVMIHADVTKASERFQAETGRCTHVTPASFLELLRVFGLRLAARQASVGAGIDRLRGGLGRIRATGESVGGMRQELTRLQPTLATAMEDTEKLMKAVANDQAEADKVREVVMREETEVAEIARDAQALADSARAELDVAMPAYHASIKALETLNKSDIVEVKSFISPPPLVRVVMDAVCLLLGAKQTWEDAKKLLGDMQFIQTLQTYDKDSITEGLLRKLRRYIENPQFQPEVVQKVSRAATCLCMWVRAIDTYARVYRDVQPKKARHAEATAKLEAAEAQLEVKRSQLAEVDARVASLRTKYEDSQAKLDELQRMIEETKVRLTRAQQLLEGLGGESERWERTAAELEASRGSVDGDMLVAAGCISYLGPFTAEYRTRLRRRWLADVERRGIRVDAELTLERALGDPVTVQQWKLMGLPNDSFSVSNAIIATHSRRWPYLIDPQGQGNRWLKALERDAGLAVLSPTDPNLLRTLENAIRVGTPVLLQDCPESLDPALEPVLLQSTTRRAGRTLLRLGDTEIDYSPDFRLFLTSKRPNPYLLPELFVRVTVINFTVTPGGLEDQLLAHVVGIERPELEASRAGLVTRIGDGKKRLRDNEDAMLKLIAGSGGSSSSGGGASASLVDDPSLVETLAASKETSLAVTRDVEEAETTAVAIDEARERYRAVARRGSRLFFVLPDLASVDPMYQYSLAYFVKLFRACISGLPVAETVEERVAQLIPAITRFVFVNVARGLFEKDKVFFSLGIAIALMRGEDRLPPSEMQFVLRGAAVTDEAALPPNPCPELLSSSAWPLVADLDAAHPAFGGIARSFAADPAAWQAFIDARDPVTEEAFAALPGRFGRKESAAAAAAAAAAPTDGPPKGLTTWQRIMLLRALREEKLVFALRALIVEELGSEYLEFPPFDLDGAYKDSGPVTPVIFVLSPGADPTAALLAFAKTKGMDKRLHMVSLGQGQGPRAEALMKQASRDGDWVCLQNCHLAASWMPAFERLQDAALEAGASDVSADYRLWLTSAPSAAFPIPVLQNGIKLTNEPPRGLKANLTRSLASISPEDYDDPVGCAVPTALRKLTFGLVYFHAIVQERRKYGPIGWNIPYEWNDSDLGVSARMLRQYAQQASASGAAATAKGGRGAAVEDDSSMQYTALTQLIGEIHYGGRVTDRMDLVCTKSLVGLFICPEITRDGYTFPGPAEGEHGAGAYRAPPSSVTTLEEARGFVAGLPDTESPEVFGLDPNTVITFERKETAALIDTLIIVQPRGGAAGGGGATTSAAAGGEKDSGGDNNNNNNDDDNNDGDGEDEEVVAAGSADDKFVLGLVEAFEDKMPQPLDKVQAHPSTFALTETGAMNSLGVVLAQEIVRFNNLISVIRASLVELRRAIRGEVVMSAKIEAMFGSFLFQQVPNIWTVAAYPSLRPLGAWFADLNKRVTALESWLTRGPPASFWLPGLFFPQGFLTGTLQAHARKHTVAIDTLAFRCHIVEADVSAIRAPPRDGVHVHGLYIEGARWDRKRRALADAAPKELSVEFPVVHLEPTAGTTRPRAAKRFVGLPIYRTSERRGVLSTTGRSTNFVTTLLVNSLELPDKWIRRGTALVCERV
jgi:dynein heavy chain